MLPGAIAGIVIGAVFALHIVVALVLSCCAPPLPWTRRKRGPFRGGMHNIAHRGGSLIAPENTLLAFKRAVEDGHSDMLELDVCETLDGVVVVTHDNELGRICGDPRLVTETNFADLPLLSTRIDTHFPAPHHGDAYVMHPADVDAFGPQPFCTLRDVFAAFPDVAMHVDAKYDSVSTVAEIIRLVREFKREDRTIIGGGTNVNSVRIREEAAKDPQLFTFASGTQVAKAYIAFYLGVLPWIPFQFDAFDIPLPTRALANMPALDGRGCLRCLLRNLLYAPTLWRHLQQRGVRVFGFVLNSSECFDEVAAWPIDGIMTDDPVALHQWYRYGNGRGAAWVRQPPAAEEKATPLAV